MIFSFIHLDSSKQTIMIGNTQIFKKQLNYGIYKIGTILFCSTLLTPKFGVIAKSYAGLNKEFWM